MADKYDLIAEVNLDDEPYQFYVAGVFYDETHNGYQVATDAGCSCTYPWEYGPDFNTAPVGLADAIKQFRECFNNFVTLDRREAAVQELREHAEKVGARK